MAKDERERQKNLPEVKASGWAKGIRKDFRSIDTQLVAIECSAKPANTPQTPWHCTHPPKHEIAHGAERTPRELRAPML
eukprot:14054399-Alexandrium_andersonii.AAC.1